MSEPCQELGAGNTYSLGGSIPFLKSQKFDPEEEFFEFMIPGKITPMDIKSVLTLPYEIALTEQNGSLILTTGTRYSFHMEEGYSYRKNNTKVSLHSHPDLTDEIPAIAPSLNDIYITGFTDRNTTHVLAHPGGIMIYQAPMINPDTGESAESMAVREVMFKYCENRKIDTSGGLPGLKKFRDLSDQEQVDLTRKFIEESGMIVDEATWEGGRGLDRLVASIFGNFN